MAIDTTHPRYNEKVAEWTRIEDITRMKNLSQYLVTLNAQDTSTENKTRNLQYKERAIFYAIASQTVQGMLGSIFRKWPEINIPDVIEYVKTNADGAGNSIYQSSQAVTDDVLRKGRAGLHVTFPHTDGQVSRADMLSGRMVATIHRFEPEQIINWRVEQDGSRSRLTLVVTKEVSEEQDEDYSSEEVTIYREMVLDYPRDEEGNPTSDRRSVYIERIWKSSIGNALMPVEEYTPTDAQGKAWDEIPFIFIGSENNDTVPDFPPMLPIVELNVGHYRNSADYEDSTWFCGQPQPWMSGITQDHIDMLKANQMYVGSRNLVGVPSGESFGFAQAAPNPMVAEAMTKKIEGMVQMGARLMQMGSATKTAEQASGEREAQTSVLAMVASNVSEAYTQALVWVCRYMGADDKDVTYTLSQEFVKLASDPQELQQIVAGFIQGAVPMGDYIHYMRRKEYFRDDVADDEYMELLGNAGAM